MARAVMADPKQVAVDPKFLVALKLPDSRAFPVYPAYPRWAVVEPEAYLEFPVFLPWAVVAVLVAYPGFRLHP